MQGEDGSVDIAIDQHGCDRIRIIRKSSYLGTITSESHTLQLDGNEQQDSPWLGSTERCRTSAKFVRSELQIRVVMTDGPKLTMIYSLNRERDLSEESRGFGGPVIAKRQK